MKKLYIKLGNSTVHHANSTTTPRYSTVTPRNSTVNRKNSTVNRHEFISKIGKFYNTPILFNSKIR